MTTRTDWTAPHWEAVAAEQLLLAPTLVKRNADRTVRIARSPHGGRSRLKHPETGAGLLTHADVMRWTLDGMAETPDGRTVEPDDPDSWLVLCGLI